MFIYIKIYTNKKWGLLGPTYVAEKSKKMDALEGANSSQYYYDFDRAYWALHMSQKSQKKFNREK